MVVVGVLMTRGTDARWLIGAGLVVMAASSYWMARMNLQISPAQVAYPRMGLTLGLGLIFAGVAQVSGVQDFIIPALIFGITIGPILLVIGLIVVLVGAIMVATED